MYLTQELSTPYTRLIHSLCISRRSFPLLILDSSTPYVSYTGVAHSLYQSYLLIILHRSWPLLILNLFNLYFQVTQELPTPYTRLVYSFLTSHRSCPLLSCLDDMLLFTTPQLPGPEVFLNQCSSLFTLNSPFFIVESSTSPCSLFV